MFQRKFSELSNKSKNKVQGEIVKELDFEDEFEGKTV
jgi:hypothetical protein